jgi:hypothetical protein
MNPNLKFGQFHPGLAEGTPYGIIETTKLADGYFFDVVSLLTESAAWTAEDHRK